MITLDVEMEHLREFKKIKMKKKIMIIVVMIMDIKKYQIVKIEIYKNKKKNDEKMKQH